MDTLIQLGEQAKKASRYQAQASTQEKNAALRTMSAALLAHSAEIIAANHLDIEQAQANGIPEPMIDRLLLTKERIQDMAEGILEIAELPDPIGEVNGMWKNEAGLMIGQQRVPLGVIGIIYESRPNVTTDAGALCFKSGNAVILRGGKEAIHSNQILVTILQNALATTAFPPEAIQLVTDTSRETARELMRLNRYLDVLIPRGGARLIQTVLEG